MSRRRNDSYLRIFAVVIAVSLLAAGLPSAQPANPKLAVHFIDVGQADAVLIVDEARSCVILIDSGEARSKASKENLRTYLQKSLPANGTINLAIASHPHSDHIGSMQWVLETYRVRTYIDSGYEYDSTLYDNLMRVVKQQQRQGQLEHYTYGSVPVVAQTSCGASGPQVETLYPRQGIDLDLCEQNANNCSVVTRLTFGTAAFLFPGDAEEEQEQLLLNDPDIKKKLDADVLKVPHHGSDTSSSPEFLEAVSPRWVVVSAGEKNVGTNKGYKHPRLVTVRNLLAFAGEKAHSRPSDAYDATKKQWVKTSIWGRFFVTAKDGTVILETNGSQIEKK